MTENSENLTREVSLLNEKIVELREGYNEYVTIGVDPISFEPVVRICNTVGTATTYVSLGAWYFGGLISYLRQELDNADADDDCKWYGSCNDTGVAVESILDDICRLRSAHGKVDISCDAAYLIAYEKAVEIYQSSKKYYEEYYRHKPTIRKYRFMEYQKYFPNGFDHLKACTEFPILAKYFGIE